MKNVMVDIETLGNGHRAAIVSIAAVVFDEDGPSDEVFNEKINWNDTLKHGEITSSTLTWWMKQSSIAQDSIINGTKNLRSVMREFQQWFPKGGVIWGNGPTFDITIMEHAFNEVSVKIPWHYRNVRDVRTIVDLTRGFVDAVSFRKKSDVAHDALSDAKCQARYTGAMMKTIRLSLTNACGLDE